MTKEVCHSAANFNGIVLNILVPFFKLFIKSNENQPSTQLVDLGSLALSLFSVCRAMGRRV